MRLFSQNPVNSVESFAPCLGVSPVTMTLVDLRTVLFFSKSNSALVAAFAAVSTLALATLALLKVSSFVSSGVRVAVRQSEKDLVICSIMF